MARFIAGKAMRWPLEAILAGLEEGLRKAAQAAPEGIASIAVDGWGVDYVRLARMARPLRSPSAIAMSARSPTKEAADAIIGPLRTLRRTGALPHRINTVYQLLADPACWDSMRSAPWVMLPEYVLHWLVRARVAEYTHASHTGLVNLQDGRLGSEICSSCSGCRSSGSADCSYGNCHRPLTGPLAFSRRLSRDPADCAGLSRYGLGDRRRFRRAWLDTLYICSGTWSLVGTLIDIAGDDAEAFDARYTNLGAATGGLLLPLAGERHVAAEAMHGRVGAEGRGGTSRS